MARGGFGALPPHARPKLTRKLTRANWIGLLTQQGGGKK